jgi:hypothetical protein
MLLHGRQPARIAQDSNPRLIPCRGHSFHEQALVALLDDGRVSASPACRPKQRAEGLGGLRLHHYEVRELKIVAQDELACAHSLNHIAGTLADGRVANMWV